MLVNLKEIACRLVDLKATKFKVFNDNWKRILCCHIEDVMTSNGCNHFSIYITHKDIIKISFV